MCCWFIVFNLYDSQQVIIHIEVKWAPVLFYNNYTSLDYLPLPLHYRYWCAEYAGYQTTITPLCKQSLWVYTWITLSVCPFVHISCKRNSLMDQPIVMKLDIVTVHVQTWQFAWRNVTLVRNISRETMSCAWRVIWHTVLVCILTFITHMYIDVSHENEYRYRQNFGLYVSLFCEQLKIFYFW